MTRRQRQLDELRCLCDDGAIGHAIDLAYEHFAEFGPDDGIANLIADAMEHTAVASDIRRRFDELLSPHQQSNRDQP